MSPRRAQWFRAALGVASVACALACPFTAAAASVPSRPGVAKAQSSAAVQIAGVAYTPARDWFASLGYQATWSAKTKTLQLTGRAGTVVLEADTREASIHGSRVFLGEAPVIRRGALYVATTDIERLIAPILRPARLSPRPAIRTVAIDAGHGGHDSGTRNLGLKLDEKTATLDVARRLEKLLAASGWRVVLTRSNDRYVGLPDRPQLANRAQADVFISIHFNAVTPGSPVRGTETYVLTPRGQRSSSASKSSAEDRVAYAGNRHDMWSAVLGWHMHRQMIDHLHTEDRGFKRARFAVLRDADCPAVLVEAAYLSNDAEARRVATPEFRGDIAESLAAALQAYAASLDAARARSASR